MNPNLTALEELIEYCKSESRQTELMHVKTAYRLIEVKALYLLEKEKNDIMDAFDKGIEFGSGFDNSEDYYKKTFNK